MRLHQTSGESLLGPVAYNSALKTYVILHTSILAGVCVCVDSVCERYRDCNCVSVHVCDKKVCDCVSLCIRDVIRVTGYVALSDGRGDCA